jgi:hypothetical protein
LNQFRWMMWNLIHNSNGLSAVSHSVDHTERPSEQTKHHGANSHHHQRRLTKESHSTWIETGPIVYLSYFHWAHARVGLCLHESPALTSISPRKSNNSPLVCAAAEKWFNKRHQHCSRTGAFGVCDRRASLSFTWLMQTHTHVACRGVIFSFGSELRKSFIHSFWTQSECAPDWLTARRCFGLFSLLALTTFVLESVYKRNAFLGTYSTKCTRAAHVSE